MYGTTIHILKAEHFPELVQGKRYGTPQTQPLPIQGEGAAEFNADPATSIMLLGLSAHGDFDRLHCEHEMLRPVAARWGGKSFSQLIVQHSFELYRHHQRRDLLIARGVNGQIVRAAMKVLKRRDEFEVVDAPVDISTLRQALRKRRASTSAAFFSKLRIRKVEAVALYGPDVDESEDFERLEGAGELRGITTETLVAGGIEKFLVTQRRTVVVYHRNKETEVLTFAIAVNDLIDELAPPATTPRAA